MGYESREQFSGIDSLKNDIILSKIEDYVVGGLTNEEASDLVEIERIEQEGGAYVQLSESEKTRKKEYLKKLKKINKLSKK